LPKYVVLFVSSCTLSPSGDAGVLYCHQSGHAIHPQRAGGYGGVLGVGQGLSGVHTLDLPRELTGGGYTA